MAQSKNTFETLVGHLFKVYLRSNHDIYKQGISEQERQAMLAEVNHAFVFARNFDEAYRAVQRELPLRKIEMLTTVDSMYSSREGNLPMDCLLISR